MGEGRKVVLLEKVVDTHAQQLGDETYVVPVVEPVQEVDAFAARGEEIDISAGGVCLWPR